MTRQTITRATSAYTLRVSDPTDAASLAASAEILSVPLSDTGEHSITFRAADDAAATETATRIHVHSGATTVTALTTGLGVHRRTVAVA